MATVLPVSVVAKMTAASADLGTEQPTGSEMGSSELKAEPLEASLGNDSVY